MAAASRIAAARWSPLSQQHPAAFGFRQILTFVVQIFAWALRCRIDRSAEKLPSLVRTGRTDALKKSTKRTKVTPSLVVWLKPFPANVAIIFAVFGGPSVFGLTAPLEQVSPTWRIKSMSLRRVDRCRFTGARLRAQDCPHCAVGNWDHLEGSGRSLFGISATPDGICSRRASLNFVCPKFDDNHSYLSF